MFYVDNKSSYSLIQTLLTTDLLAKIVGSAYSVMFFKLLFIILILA